MLNTGKGVEDDNDTNGSFLPVPAQCGKKGWKLITILTVVFNRTCSWWEKGRKVMMLLRVVLYPNAGKGLEDDRDTNGSSL